MTPPPGEALAGTKQLHSSCSSVTKKENQMSQAEHLEEIAVRWMTEGWKNGNSGVVDDLQAADFIDHDSAGRSPGNDGFKQGIEALYAAFPDLCAEIEDLVIDTASTTVAIRWSATGTHRGEFHGVDPSGGLIRFKGIEIIRIRDGLIAERWGEWDGIDLLEQMTRPIQVH